MFANMPISWVVELVGLIALVSSFCGLFILVASLTFYLAVRFSLDRLRGWANATK